MHLTTAGTTARQCPACTATVPPMDATCPDCGHELGTSTTRAATEADLTTAGTTARQCPACTATVPPMDATCPDCGHELGTSTTPTAGAPAAPPPRYTWWSPPSATVPAAPTSDRLDGPYRASATTTATTARIVTGRCGPTSGHAPPVVLLTADTVDGLGSARRTELRHLTVEPDLGAGRLVAETTGRRVVLARGELAELEAFARQLAGELAVPVATAIAPTAARPGPTAWSRAVDSTGTIALVRRGRGPGRRSDAGLGRHYLRLSANALYYAPRAGLALDGLDYFDLTPAPEGDDLRAVVARGVDGTTTQVFVGPPWVAAELCARLAVELTRWRMLRHARRLAPASG